MTQAASVKNILNKVPEATLVFWMIKILATTVGETGADFLIFNMHLGLTVTSFVMGGFLMAALFVQVKTPQYVPWIYWVTVVLISIVGTLITDNLTDHFEVPLQVTTILFSALLAVTFLAWHVSEKTLSIHTINTFRREGFYWSAILFTFALGTAAGDLSSESLGLGYEVSALVYGSMIALITIAYYKFKLNPVLAFWLAYILTRPFGASWGDYISQPAQYGGLDLGVTGTSMAFFVIIAGLIAYLHVEKK